MVRESDGPDTLKDFCRNVGAPFKIKSDKAQMEIGNKMEIHLQKIQHRTANHGATLPMAEPS